MDVVHAVMGKRTMGRLIVGLCFAAAVGAPAVARRAEAATAPPPPPTLQDTPSSTLVGTTVDVALTGAHWSPASCPAVSISFSGGGSTTVKVLDDGTLANGHFTVAGTFPAGNYTFTAFCARLNKSATAPFTIIAKATTTTTSTTVKKTTTTTSTTVKKTTTTRPTTTTTSTTVPGETTTTSTTLPGESTTTPTSVPETTTTSPDGPGLTLDKPSIPPGGAVGATGRGCDPGSGVDLSAGGKPAGRTTATSDGTFSAPLAIQDITPGRIQVVAVCGPTLTAPLDIVLASRVDPGSSTLVVLVFFVLIGAVVVRRTVRW